MSYQAFTRLFFGLLILAGVLMIGNCGFHYSQPMDTITATERWLFGACFLTLGGALGSNTLCGVMHGRMQARGGPAEREKIGKVAFALILVINAALAAMLLFYGVDMLVK